MFAEIQQMGSGGVVRGVAVLEPSRTKRQEQGSCGGRPTGFQLSDSAIYAGVTANKKGRSDEIGPAFEFNPGDDLRSHTVTRAVSSALRGLTTVFGMGTGVTLAV